MKEDLKGLPKIVRQEIKPVISSRAHVAPYGSNGTAGSSMSLIDIVSKTNLVDEAGKRFEYYVESIVPGHENGPYSNFLPDEEVILSAVVSWLQEKARFEQLSKKQRDAEKLKSLVGLSNFQSVFKQVELRQTFNDTQINNSRIF